MRELVRILAYELTAPLTVLVFLLVASMGWLLAAYRLGRSSSNPMFMVRGILAVSLVVFVGVLVAVFSNVPRPVSGLKLALFLQPLLPWIGGAGAAAVVLLISGRLMRSRATGALLFIVLVSLIGAAVYLVRSDEMAERLVRQLTPVPFEFRFGLTGNNVIDADSADEEVFVPAGTFIMGSLSPDQMQTIVGNDEGDEAPVRSHYVAAFFIDRNEVTNARFSRFVEETSHITDAETNNTGRRWSSDGWVRKEGLSWREPMFPGDSIDNRGDHPVVQVSWNDASRFCEWAGKRLPSEAEWEKAARGPDGLTFPWGNQFVPENVNYCDVQCADLPQHKDSDGDDGYQTTAPVGMFPGGVSRYGANDMAGNVWEWVNDGYDPYYYYYSPEYDPRGPAPYRITHRVVRGGSFTSERGYVRTTSRSYDPPGFAYFGVGFRCARSAGDSDAGD